MKCSACYVLSLCLLKFTGIETPDYWNTKDRVFSAGHEEHLSIINPHSLLLYD